MHRRFRAWDQRHDHEYDERRIAGLEDVDVRDDLGPRRILGSLYVPERFS